MESAWILYILVFLANGQPDLELRKYATSEECESASVRVTEELA